MSNFNEEKLKLVKEALSKSKREISTDWLDIKDTHNFEHSGDNLRKYSTGWKLLEEWGLVDFDNLQPINTDMPNYKETHELVAGGLQKSDKLIKMNAQQAKDVDYVLSAHGFDGNEWELVSAKNNIWNVNSKLQGVQTLYSSKITVKPKVSGFNVDKFLEKIDKIKPIKINRPKEFTKSLLEIPLYDMHFGIGTIEHYLPVLYKISEKIASKKWDKILFTIGQDLIQTDGFTGQTTSGTIIGRVDVEKAWSDAYSFYKELIEEALQNSLEVDVIFSDGNHDQAMGWAFVKTLEATFPQVNFNTEMKKFKAFTWEEVFIGITHGDKAQNRLMNVFLAEYGSLIAKAKVKELHTGHLHHQITKDNFGIVQRTLGSGVPHDSYHYENGFIGAVKTFQLFEYSPDKLEAIYFV